MAHPSKVKGNVLEQNVAKDLRKKYPFCKTTRMTSKLLDDCKIDLSGLPFLVQCKAGYNYPRLKYDDLYLQMKGLITTNFPEHHPIHNLPYVLVNKLNRVKGGKMSQPEMNQVTITYDFFLELLENYKSKNVEI